MAEPEVNMKQVQDDIKKVKEFIDAIEQLGGKMPELKRAVGYLEIAVNTPADLGSAMQETSRALAAYTNDLYKACGDDYVCQAGVDRKWQARNVEWVLSWDKKESTVRLFIRNTLCRYMPELISKRLEYCAPTR